MTRHPLRPYQTDALDGLRGVLKQHRAALLVMPTGAGKTRTAAEMVDLARAKRTPTLWLADRRELVEQASEAFTALGIRHGLILPGHRPGENELILCGTIQSFLARHRRGSFNPEHIRFIVLDEAHRAESNTYQELLRLYPNARVVGLTATPIRGDGKGLGRTFGGMVQPVSTQTLMEEGYLVPPRYFIPSEMDLVNARNGKGDFTQKDLDAIADSNPQLIGDVVSTFARVCPERRAVTFPCNIRHSLALRDAFNAAGIPACHIDGQTPDTERRELMQAFREGEYQVLTSVNIAIEGLDVPDVSAVIMARPTRSERIWIQAVGRGLRSHASKTDCVVLDHAGVMLSLGPAEDAREWSLEDTETKERQASKKSTTPRDPKDITCEQCSAVFFSSSICPACGHEHHKERAPKDVEVAAGELQELTAEGRQHLEYSQEEKKRWWAELQWAGQGKKEGWAWHKYRAKFGVGPGGWQKQIKPAIPTAEVLAFIRAQNIAYAKRMEAERLKNAAD